MKSKNAILVTMIQCITEQLLDSLLEQARTSPRKRVMFKFHVGAWEHAHRMVNAITPLSYVQPHRHLDPYKSEGFIILRGKVAVVIFDDAGKLDTRQTTIIGAGCPAIGADIPPGIWHGLLALEDSALYEVKGQPGDGYDQRTDKEFAAWAPPEGDEGAERYRAQLRDSIHALLRSDAGL